MIRSKQTNRPSRHVHIGRTQKPSSPLPLVVVSASVSLSSSLLQCLDGHRRRRLYNYHHHVIRYTLLSYLVHYDNSSRCAFASYPLSMLVSFFIILLKDKVIVTVAAATVFDSFDRRLSSMYHSLVSGSLLLKRINSCGA